MSIDGIINEPTVNFVGKDGFYWWVGEVEDNEDPMELGRCKVRVLGYYTNVRGGTTADLPTKELPWATVLQHTSQAGNDGQGESSGQLQPGAIVMGFFMDGENAQMPVVIGVLRVNKSADSGKENVFAFTGEKMEAGSQGLVNPVMYNPADPTYSGKVGGNKNRETPNNSVPIPGNKTTSQVNGPGAPGTSLGSRLNGSKANPNKPQQPSKPIPAANGVAGPWKTLEYKLTYLVEDIAGHAGTLVKADGSGNFLDVVEGKIVSVKALTAKVQNFLGGVFTAVVAAIRQQIADLAEQLELATLLGGVAGAPYVVMTAVQQAITTLLGALCEVDNQLLSLIQDPIGTLTGYINDFVDGLIDQAAMVVGGVQSLIDGIVCNIQGLLNQMLKVVDVVSGIVDGISAAKDVIDAWKGAGGMFSGGADGFAKGLTSITGIMALILKFVQGDCGRAPTDGADAVGWFPLYGVTHCTDAELAAINKILGLNKANAKCGDPFGTGSLIDDLYNTADPFLTQAKTFLDGAYELHIGTPGRRASVTKRASGTTQLSININNDEKQEHAARQQIKEENPNASEEEIERKVSQAKKTATGNKEDGNLVADDINYGGNLTQVVNGDDCKVVKNDNCITIDGDYRLKVSGNCHIEVGGGFFLSAEGAPRTVDKNGEKTGQDKIQKHQIRFGSDVDLGINGAKLQVSAAELDTDIKKAIIQGGSLETKHSNTSISAGSVNISGENDITNTTNHLFNNCGLIPSLAQLGKSGITNTVGGDILNIMTPTLTNPAPTYMIQNTTGQWVGNFLTGYALNVATGGYSCKVGAGAWDTSVGAAATLNAGGAVSITAGAVCKITAVTIFLN